MKFDDTYLNCVQAQELANRIVRHYRRYNVSIDIRQKDITVLADRYRFRVKFLPGGKVDGVKKYARDIQIGMRLSFFRVIEEKIDVYLLVSKAPLSGFNWHNYLEILICHNFKQKGIAHLIGRDAFGKIIINDVTLYPHALIAGTTGSGKSSAVKMLLICILSQYSPKEVNLLVCDLADELLDFNGFPQLSYPVIQNVEQFFCVMKKLQDEMERRIKIKGSDEYLKLPRIVCVVDEFTSFVAGTDAQSAMVRKFVMNILRRGRHAKIHMILAAHNPTKKQLKLDISDIPTKLVFRVARMTDSVAILGRGGAEKLAGNGEMLFQSSQSSEIQQIQGAYIPDKILGKMLLPMFKNEWVNRSYDAEYQFVIREEDMQEAGFEEISNIWDKSMTARQSVDDKLFAEIILWILSQDEISGNKLCEKFRIGWRRANCYIKRLQNWGMVEELDAKLPRRVIIGSVEDLPDELMEILYKSGYSDEQIISAYYADV